MQKKFANSAMSKRCVSTLIYLLLANSILSVTINTAFSANLHYESWHHARQTLVEKAVYRQWIPMRDGIRLDANILFPKKGNAPYPTVLIRTPYPNDFYEGIEKSENYHITTFLEHGYAIVFQNERGRYWSEGESSYLIKAKDDGYDTVEWIAKQAWSNGRVGSFGCSSMGDNQLGLSVANHPAHAAAISMGNTTTIGKLGPYQEQGFFRGGALHLWTPIWYLDNIRYSGKGAHYRPQFPNNLTREERVKLAQHFNLYANTPDKDFNYAKYIDHLPISEINQAVGGLLTDWDDFSRRTPAVSEWRDRQYVNEGDTFGVPMLWVESWYDISVSLGVATYNYARDHAAKRAKGNQYLIVGPLEHCSFGNETVLTKIGEREIGDARYDYAKRYVEWFDYWLKDKRNKARQQPKVSYYQMGLNKWVTGNQFPLKKTTTVELYLHSQGNANSLYGDGELKFELPQKATFDSFVYDPLNPVPTLGGGVCCMGTLEKVTGSFDQSALEARNDILVYTSDPLTDGLNMAGFIEAELYVSSDAKDTDFTVKLVDVYPDGRAYNLDDTILRARYREGYDKKALMEKGQVYKIKFTPMITANYFKPGHRIRLEVSSSNFPRYDRNLNTGGNNYDESTPVTARNNVHHSPVSLSRVILPVAPD